MAEVIYAIGISLDGYIAGPGGDISWSVPDAELHRFHNARQREVAVQFCGRRLWETMEGWETLDQQPGASEEVLEFAPLWRATPKIVISNTLERVEGTNVRLGTIEEVAQLKQESHGAIAVGGAGLAASVLEHITDYRLFIHPVVLGGGTPCFPPSHDRIDLELVETRTFPSRVVYVRYRTR